MITACVAGLTGIFCSIGQFFGWLTVGTIAASVPAAVIGQRIKRARSETALDAHIRERVGAAYRARSIGRITSAHLLIIHTDGVRAPHTRSTRDSVAPDRLTSGHPARMLWPAWRPNQARLGAETTASEDGLLSHLLEPLESRGPEPEEHRYIPERTTSVVRR